MDANKLPDFGTIKTAHGNVYLGTAEGDFKKQFYN